MRRIQTRASDQGKVFPATEDHETGLTVKCLTLLKILRIKHSLPAPALPHPPSSGNDKPAFYKRLNIQQIQITKKPEWQPRVD